MWRIKGIKNNIFWRKGYFWRLSFTCKGYHFLPMFSSRFIRECCSHIENLIRVCKFCWQQLVKGTFQQKLVKGHFFLYVNSFRGWFSSGSKNSFLGGFWRNFGHACVHSVLHLSVPPLKCIFTGFGQLPIRIQLAQVWSTIL